MKNKKMIIPGVLFLLTTIIYLFFRFQQAKLYSLYDPNYTLNPTYIIFYCVSLIVLSICCFTYHNILLNKILYFMPLTVLFLVNAYYFILDFTYIDESIYVLLTILPELLIPIICCLFMLFRLKPKKNIANLGFILLIIYCIIYAINIFQDLTPHNIDLPKLERNIMLLRNIWRIIDPIAFLSFWWIITQNIYSKGTKKEYSGTIILEKELLTLKENFEAGNLTEEEYSRKKSKLLSRL